MDSLDEIIEGYRPVAAGYGLEDPTACFDRCGDASNDFAFYLEARGVEYEVGWHEPDDPAGYPLPLSHEWSYHMTTIVILGHRRFGIDWTARQIDPSAGFPLVWECGKIPA